MFGLGMKELVIVLAIILVIFGPGRLPDIGKSLGRGISEFKEAADGVGGGAGDDPGLSENEGEDNL